MKDKHLSIKDKHLSVKDKYIYYTNLNKSLKYIYFNKYILKIKITLKKNIFFICK